jgi:hypothetical protein
LIALTSSQEAILTQINQIEVLIDAIQNLLQGGSP